MSYQSKLGDGVAEELAENQREISIAEFFEKNKHMLGFDSGARGLVTAVKEAVDNALDATEEAGILPDVYVEITEQGDYYRLVVEDNGPGITKSQLPRVFGKLLYGSRFHRREQSRGQQGIGISAAVLYSQLTSGRPAKITSRTQGSAEAQYFELVIDTDTNEPEIREEKTVSWERSHGTRIELEMEANMRARGQLRNYIEHTAVVNPHARIEFREPALDEPLKFDRAEGAELPAETEEIRPHPHGVELGTLLKMLEATESYSVSGFLQEEFTRVGGKTSDDIVGAFRDRQFGRELAWRPPDADETDLSANVTEAVANKPPDATETFAAAVEERVFDADRLSYTNLEALVEDVADEVGEETGVTFGSTVREHAVEAAWETVADARDADVGRLVEGATTSQKDDRAVRNLAERIAAKFGEDTPRDRVTRDDLREFVDRAAEMTEEHDEETFGDTARENVVDALWDVTEPVADDVPGVADVAGERDVASRLLDAMAETSIMAPPTSCLSPITSDLVEAGLRKEFDADFYAAATRDAEVHGGDPFVVEAGIAYGGDLEADGSIQLMRFANRVPLVYQRGACAITDAVKDIGWRNYGLDQPGGRGLPAGPCVVTVHVASTNVPFTSESKDAVANVPAIEDEIELAVREAARELKSYLKKQRSLRKRRKKQDVIATILPEMAAKVADVTGREEPDVDHALARIMNNVSVERRVSDGAVELAVENHTDAGESPDVTDIVTAEPRNVSDGASVVEMDGEWFVRWSPDVPSGDEVVLEYETDADASFDLSVDGVEAEKLTVTDTDQ